VYLAFSGNKSNRTRRAARHRLRPKKIRRNRLPAQPGKWGNLLAQWSAQWGNWPRVIHFLSFSFIFEHFSSFSFGFRAFSLIFVQVSSKIEGETAFFQKNSLVFACFSGFPKKILSDEVANRKKTEKYRKVPVLFRPKPARSVRDRCESGKFLNEMEEFRSFPVRFRTRRAPIRENSWQNRAFFWSEPKSS